MHVLSLFGKCAHDLLMTGKNDDLSALSELGQSAGRTCATVVIEIHQNVVGKHGNGGANLGRALEQRDAQRQIELLACASESNRGGN